MKYIILELSNDNVGEDSSWTNVERTAGVWIHPDEVRYVKFYSEEE